MTTTQKTALVTGANKGIGLEVARQLAERGLLVWLGCRDERRGQAAVDELTRAGDVRYIALDVTDDESVAAAATRIEEETGPLDVLINNAGVAVAEGEGRPSTVQAATLERTFEVNFYGALRVTQAFLPLVRQAPDGRIVNVSSTLGSIGTVVAPESPFAQIPSFAYPASKTLLNALTGWLAVELRDTPIKVSSVCPGDNVTDMNPGSTGQHPSEGAKVVVRAATLPADGPSGTFFDATGPVAW